MRTPALLTCSLLICGLAAAGEARPPYADDPATLAKLKALGAGSALSLGRPKIMADGQPLKNAYRGGPYSRDYTNKMVYAPERRTALYAGGNHGKGRTHDVWEYHLGSNAWHRLHPVVGGDHADHKGMLMFMPRKWNKDPNYKLSEKEQKQFDAAKAWWNKYVILKDGHYVTKDREAPLLHGHTWDTLVYEPNVKRLIQGTGAHCAGSPWLHHKFTGMPLAEVKGKLGKNPDGVPYRTMWLFDPVSGKWGQYASEEKLAVLRGMGATMCYIPDWKKIVFYVSAQNVTPNAMEMKTYDAVNEEWEVLKPNGGKSVWDLSLKMKVAPKSEAQTAYSPKHKKMVAVLGPDAFAYDIVKNEWAKLCSDERIKAHDARTIFAYDAIGDVFVLAGPRQKTRFALLDVKTAKWEVVTPKGAEMPRATYGEGKGYYDPAHNVFVMHVHGKGIWVYRHRKGD